MKPRSNPFLRHAAFAAFGILLSPCSVHAAPLYWDTTTAGTWATGANWADHFFIGGTTGTAPGASDTAVLNQSASNGAESVQLDADTSIGGIFIRNTGTTAIQSSSATPRYLTIGIGGLSINSGAGAVTLGNAGSPVYTALADSQSWINNSAAALTIPSSNAVIPTVANRVLTIGGSAATTFAAGSQLKDNTVTVGLTKIGSGVLTLTDSTTGAAGKFTFTGGVTVNAGQLLLSSTASSTSGLANIVGSQLLTMSGGTLTTTWANNVTSLSNSQTYSSTTLAPGACTIATNNSQTTVNTTKNARLFLGAITRNTGSTVTFSATGQSNTGDNRIYINSSSWTASSIILDSGVAYATANGATGSTTGATIVADNWAGTNSSSNISNLAYAATYTATDASTLTGNANVAAATDTTLGADAAPTSLRFGQAEPRTITATGFTLTTGGILVSSNVAGNASTITGGTLRSAATVAGKDLVIITNNSSGYLAIGSTIVDSTAGSTGLTKSGPSGLVLSGANTYSGPTYINGGYISIAGDSTGSSNPLGAYPASVSAIALSLNGGGLVVSGTSTLDANRGITLGGNGGSLYSATGQTLTLNGVIAGPVGTGTLNCNNASNLGTIVLTANNTFRGGITIGGGKLQLNNAGALNNTADSENAVSFGASVSGTLALNGNSVTLANLTGSAAAPIVQNDNASNATLTVGNGQNLGGTFAGIIQNGAAAGTLAFVKAGTGTLILTGTNTYTGGTSVNNGILQAGKALPGHETAGMVTVSSPGILMVNYGGATDWTSTQIDDLLTNNGSGFASGSALGFDTTNGATATPYNTYNTLISGNLGIVKAGTNRLIIDTANTFTGRTAIVGGGDMSVKILADAGTASSLGQPTGANATIEISGGSKLYYTGTGASSNRAINLGGGGGSVFNQGSGLLTLTGGVTGNGSITFRPSAGGAKNISESGAITLGAANSLTVTDGGTLTLSNATNNFGQLAIAYGTVSVNSISDNGSPSAAGSGPVTNTSSFRMGQSSSTGDTGTLSFTGAAGGSSNRTFIINNGALGGKAAFENTVVGQTLTLSGGVTVGAANAAGLTLQGAGNGVMSGVISGSLGTLSLTKAGSGTWTLSNANTYTGTTAVNEGTLIVNGDQSTATGAVTVAALATLKGTGKIGGASTTVSGILAPGASIGKLTAIGSVTLAPGSTYALEVGDWTDTTAGTGYDTLDASAVALTATAGSKLTLHLDATGISNFTESAKSFVIATAASAPTGVAADNWTVTTTGFSGTGTWSLAPSGNTLVLTYAPPVSDPFASWIGGPPYNLSGPTAAFDFDYDNDGIKNGLEWILGGNPTVNDNPSILPTVTGSAASGLTLVFNRAVTSVATTTLVVDWDTGLSAFANSILVGNSDVGPSGNNPTIDIDAPSAGKVTVNIPAANAGSGKLFARLRATKP